VVELDLDILIFWEIIWIFGQNKKIGEVQTGWIPWLECLTKKLEKCHRRSLAGFKLFLFEPEVSCVFLCGVDLRPWMKSLGIKHARYMFLVCDKAGIACMSIQLYLRQKLTHYWMLFIKSSQPCECLILSDSLSSIEVLRSWRISARMHSIIYECKKGGCALINLKSAWCGSLLMSEFEREWINVEKYFKPTHSTFLSKFCVPKLFVR
jgi:hypothetical protein